MSSDKKRVRPVDGVSLPDDIEVRQEDGSVKKIRDIAVPEQSNEESNDE